MSNARARVPLVWILKGPKAGDYAQLQLLARALDRAASDALEPPWLDLLLTAGRRNELVARWVRNASGGTSRLVHVGRPWSSPMHFDLVVSNRQYLLESCGNVIVNDLPLTDASTVSDEQTNRQTEWGVCRIHTANC